MRENNPHNPRYRGVEHSDTWPDLVDFWAEKGYKYDYSIGCFTIFDEYHGVTDWMTWKTALDRAIDEMEANDTKD